MSQILCEMCGLKPATIHFSQTINGMTSEKHLCPSCAKRMQVVNIEGFLNPAKIISSALTQNKPKQQRVCRCGTTEQEFLRDFKFGCAECYTVFEDMVERYLGHLTQSGHKGKAAGAEPKPISEIERLRAELKKAVLVEDYDRAAHLKKQIEALEHNSEA